MKTTLLLTAVLLCTGAQADFVADIYKTPSGDFFDPGPMVFAGSITYPSDPHSPALSLGGPNLDWHPFGLTWFTATIHGTLDIQHAGVGEIQYYGTPGFYSLPGGFKVVSGDLLPGFFVPFLGSAYSRAITCPNSECVSRCYDTGSAEREPATPAHSTSTRYGRA